MTSCTGSLGQYGVHVGTAVRGMFGKCGGGRMLCLLKRQSSCQFI